MPTTNIYTTAEDGYVTNLGLVFKTGSTIIVLSSSSSSATYNEGFWFFDTSSIVGTVTATSLWVYVASTISQGTGAFEFIVCPNACIGSTLEAADLGNPAEPTYTNIGQIGDSATPAQWYEIPFPDPTYINRSGYTNVRCHFSQQAEGIGSTMRFASFEASGGVNKAYLAITTAAAASGTGNTLPMMGVG